MKLYSCKVLIFYTKGYNAKEDWKKFRTYIVILMSTRLTQNSTKSCSYAKSLQSCLTLCNPIDGSPSGSPVLGFSRQEHWSGLPFPSPMHESEKWKWSCSVVSDSVQLHGLQPTRLLHPWDFPGKSTGVGCHFLLWIYGTHCIILLRFLSLKVQG